MSREGWADLDAAYAAAVAAPPRHRLKSTVRNNRYELRYAQADAELTRLSVRGTQFRVFHHIECGAQVAVPIRCASRACPECGRQRRQRFLSKYAHAVASFKNPAILTLTVRNVKSAEDLPAALETLLRGFQRLRQRSVWKKCKGFASVEITWSAEKGFHPHIHAVCDLPWIDLAELTRIWTELTGALHQPDVKRISVGDRGPERSTAVMKYVTKSLSYITKAWKQPPEALRTVLAALSGRRVFTPFGGLKAAQAEWANDFRCPRCGDVFPGVRGHRDEWDTYTVSGVDLAGMKTRGPLWADFYDGWRCEQVRGP